MRCDQSGSSFIDRCTVFMSLKSSSPSGARMAKAGRDTPLRNPVDAPEYILDIRVRLRKTTAWIDSRILRPW
ncbi:MAG: hypothetical protein LJE91_17890 [Gammaproteobacteria bacterium]|jgi:hypothetical protein|nr:hypothetical protein [Gammaproteobacteria bacterium]